MNKLKNDNLLNALCLHNDDNILITLTNIKSGMFLNEHKIKTDVPALAGQKIARFDIQKDAPILKYGTVIGFADSNIKKGQVLTNKNVLLKNLIENIIILQNINQQIILKIICRKLLWDINVKMEGLEQEIILR